MKQVTDPIATMALEATGPDLWWDWELRHHPAGELRIYHPHSEKEDYYIGADVGEGKKGKDYSVASILDGRRREVAKWRARCDPDHFTKVLYFLAKFFNDAQLCVELNNHGILPNSRLSKDYNYPNLYYTTEIDKITERESTTFGFRTTVKSKPLIIDQLRARVREGEIEINDKVTLGEMQTFVINESGAMEAENGCFDDSVIALALANHINEGTYKPVESSDDFYVEAI
jgi:hypothetical protein